jgi:glycine/D-amino acid oxidase-like deaminating enzyme/nitrite reductase/ring-hydroxylating ferredoxin subunit
LHPSDKTSSLEKEQEAASAAGVKVTLLNEVPGIPHEKGASLQFENQAQFHPMRYLYGLAEAIRKKGGEIFTETHADEITAEGIKTSEGFRISADHIVIATNSPVNNKYAIHLKQFPYRSYVIGALVPKNSIEHALWWDTGDYELNPRIPPYHYVRLAPHNERHDLLICGGEDHPTGLSDAEHLKEENRYDKLIHWLKERFSIDSIAYRWSGQVMEPMDSLAYIGRNPFDKKNVYIVTGDSGNGMTHGTIAGMLIPDLITGKENPWEKLYSPSRLKLLKAGTTLFKEFFGGLIKYMKESPKHTDEIAVSSISPGEGKIIEFRKEKFGVYRDTDSNYHIVSAVCTHLQCSVNWNNDEKSWDCPCHGSRFTITGKVMNGPANEGLWYYQEDQPEYLDILRNTDS